MAATNAMFQLDCTAPGTVAVRGSLSFATAAAALQALNVALHAGDRQRLDLASVSACDSAGLACVLAVLAQAREHGQFLQLQHVPSGMQTLARVSGVEALLG